MPDQRQFTGSYDLYRPTVATSGTGEQSLSVPGTPEASDQPCLFFPDPGKMSLGEAGVEIDYDAVLITPAGQDIRPADKTSQPDQIVVGARRFVVRAYWDASGRSVVGKALLSEVKT